MGALLTAIGSQRAAGATSIVMPAWLGGGTPIVLPAAGFVLLFSATWLVCVSAVLLMPRGLRFTAAAALILTVAIVYRMLLLPHPHSDDVNRYLWEGRLVVHGLSPYVHPPHASDDPAADFLRDPSDPYWPHINHPHLTAIYGPLALLLFGAVAHLAYSAAALKLVLVGFDLATLIALLAILRARRLDARWAWLYAINPVVLYGVAGEGHLDVVPTFFLTATLALHQWRRWRWMYLAAGLAVPWKYVTVVALPYLVSRTNRRHLWIAAAAAAAPMLWFLPGDGLAVFSTLRRFADGFDFNGPAHALLTALTGDAGVAALCCRLAFAAWWGASLGRRWLRSGIAPADPAAGALLATGVLLVLSRTVHFWYVTWLIPLLVIRPSLPWLLLSGSIGWTAVAYGNLALGGGWRYPTTALLAVWALPLAALALKAWPRAPRNGRRWARPDSVTVIVPTRNEGARIGACVSAVAADPAVSQILVVDAGSGDGTATAAAAYGATVVAVDGPPSRGGQVRAGLARARGDVVAVVHADTRVEPGTFSRVVAVLRANPDVVGGAVGERFAAPGIFLRLLEAANAARAALAGISFGDQVQFFRREPVQEENLFPDLPLMEDVELCLRLRRFGRLTFLWGAAAVEPRRWRARRLAHAWLVGCLLTRFLAARALGRVDAAALHRCYYGARPAPTLPLGAHPPSPPATGGSPRAVDLAAGELRRTGIDPWGHGRRTAGMDG
jgi:hypothetical protein